MKRKRIVSAAVAVVVVAVGGAVAVTLPASSGKGAARQSSGLLPATAPIQRGDLSDSTQKQGTLGYAKERKINAGTMGTLTWVAGAGSSVARDGRLYEVDGRPVRLMYGTTPMYRPLKTGDKGDDVRQLKENLRALGFGPEPAADGTFTTGTADAVKRWQKAHDLPRTGTVGPDRIAFSAGPVRIKSADSAVGDQAGPGKPVLTTTSSERIVEFKLAVADGQLARTGSRVTVDLPGGGSAPGRVSSVGKTVEEGEDPQDRTPKITVTVTFDDPSKVGGLDRSPVTVNLTGRTRKGVLSVPVNALLALPSGGFGVQVVENGRARDVAVELGMFGQGRVEVSGGGLREGMKVGVPSL
ncbi:peptidoglycan-binding protein [Streptomyces sp. NPDC006733]|uniref:peptidoglycan-binding protein n=1 Tax=Streptomyces sp. NPDC006733 TaxID=3155460 RepID=UPI003400E2B7